LIIALVENNRTDEVMKAARYAGATGSTIINHARGEGIDVTKSFFGLAIQAQTDVLLFLLAEHLSRNIMETLAEVGHFEQKRTGIAFQLDVEDAAATEKMGRAVYQRAIAWR